MTKMVFVVAMALSFPAAAFGQTDGQVRTGIHWDTRSERKFDLGAWMIVPDATAPSLRLLIEAGVGVKDKRGRKAELVLGGVAGNENFDPAVEVRTWLPFGRMSAFGDLFYVFPTGKIMVEWNWRVRIAQAGKLKLVAGPESNTFPRGSLFKAEDKEVLAGIGPGVGLGWSDKMLVVAGYQFRNRTGNMFRVHVVINP